MYDARTKLAEQVEQEVREHFGDRVYKTVVPRTVRLSEAPSFGQPIIVFDSTSRGAVGVPGAGERGEQWRDAAGWVRGSGHSSRRANRGERSGGLEELPVAAIRPNRYQPREHFDEEALALARRVDPRGRACSSRSSCGRVGRRLRADRGRAPLAGGAPGRAADHPRAGPGHRRRRRRSSTRWSRTSTATDLNPLEEAAAYQQLIEDFGLTHEEVAIRVGRSRTTVTNTLRLLQLPPTIQRLVQDRSLTMGHARALLGTPDRAFQEQLAKRIVAEDLSVRAVEEAVREHERATPTTPAPTRRRATGGDARTRRRQLRPPGLLELEELLGDHLDTRVKIDMGAKRGKVAIEFSTLEDLERIYRLITE